MQCRHTIFSHNSSISSRKIICHFCPMLLYQLCRWCMQDPVYRKNADDRVDNKHSGDQQYCHPPWKQQINLQRRDRSDKFDHATGEQDCRNTGICRHHDHLQHISLENAARSNSDLRAIAFDFIVKYIIINDNTATAIVTIYPAFNPLSFWSFRYLSI